MARRRFFVDEIRGGRALVAGDAAHHLTRVLRVETGQKYEISDNRDVYLAEVDAARKDFVSFSVLEKIDSPEIQAHLTLLAALIKFDRFEWLLEKATELGVLSVVPFVAERSEKGLERAAANRLARWRKIAREASEQSRRARLPEISGVLPFADAIDVKGDLRLVLEEQAGAQPILPVLTPARRSSIAICTGPEGGWTDRERAVFSAAAWTPVSLGETVLRAETAAIAALAVAGAAGAGSNNSHARESSS